MSSCIRGGVLAVALAALMPASAFAMSNTTVTSPLTRGVAAPEAVTWRGDGQYNANGAAVMLATPNFVARKGTPEAMAREFIDRQVPSQASLLIQPYSAPVHRSRASLVEALRANLGSEERASVKFQMELAIQPPLEPAYRTIYYGDGGTDADKLYVLPDEFEHVAGLEPLRRRGIHYVVLKRSNMPNPETARLEAALAREATRLVTFSPYRPDVSADERARTPPFAHNSSIRVDRALERPGPIVDVWRLE